MSFDHTVKLLRAAAEPTRFRLLALCARTQISVNELTEILGQSQPRVSRHLKLLSEAGLIERRPHGKRVYYRVPETGHALRQARMILSLIESNDDQLEHDLDGLMKRPINETPDQVQAERIFNRAILDIAATGNVGALLDIGVGTARIMKLLASSATRLVGIDNNRIARQHARQTLEHAGLTNCSVLNGDMYQLPFDYAEFDTVIMDEVLFSSDEPMLALSEAARALNDKGRLVVLEKFHSSGTKQLIEQKLAQSMRQNDLITTTVQPVIGDTTNWLIFVATKTQSN